MQPKILIVLTSHDTIDSLNQPTGWYLPELAHPYDVLSAGSELVIASPKGGVAPLDPSSVEMFKEDPSSAAFLANNKSVWETTKKLSDFVGRSEEFDAIFYPGGHGPMFDLVSDKDSIALIEEFAAAGKPVASVCHGPIVLVNAKGKDGQPLIAGKRVTGFSNVEEDQVKLSEAMPQLLEDALKKANGKYEKADEPWGVKVVTDGLLITGQNPASAKATAEALAKVLGFPKA